ncbi:hypothetical protein BREVNS_1654 [Brevinematales bacterium NS]|nr:hypothetical protein BREVNS_1654 [Brevinematales bacterium NS]
MDLLILRGYHHISAKPPLFAETREELPPIHKTRPLHECAKVSRK